MCMYTQLRHIYVGGGVVVWAGRTSYIEKGVGVDVDLIGGGSCCTRHPIRALGQSRDRTGHDEVVLGPAFLCFLVRGPRFNLFVLNLSSSA